MSVNIEDYDGFIIMVHSEVFNELINQIKANNKIIIDPWGLKEKFNHYLQYYAIFEN